MLGSEMLPTYGEAIHVGKADRMLCDPVLDCDNPLPDYGYTYRDFDDRCRECDNPCQDYDS